MVQIVQIRVRPGTLPIGETLQDVYILLSFLIEIFVFRVIRCSLIRLPIFVWGIRPKSDT